MQSSSFYSHFRKKSTRFKLVENKKDLESCQVVLFLKLKNVRVVEALLFFVLSLLVHAFEFIQIFALSNLLFGTRLEKILFIF
jgi:hypothetical protein